MPRRDPRGTFKYGKDEAGEWRWHFVDSNGRIVYGSTEGYHNKADMLKSIPRCNEVESAFRLEV